MQSFISRARVPLQVNQQFVVTKGLSKKDIEVGELYIKEETMDIDIAVLLDLLNTGSNFDVEFMYNNVRFWIYTNGFGSLTTTGITLYPYIDASIDTSQLKIEMFNKKLTKVEIAQKATEMYSAIKGVNAGKNPSRKIVL